MALAAAAEPGVAPILLVLALFIFVSALLGMQLFGAKHFEDDSDDDGDFTRNMRFDSFGWALAECFAVLCDENWSERIYIVMATTRNPLVALYFVVVLVFGQYVLANLCLAIILNGSEGILAKDFSTQQYRATLLNIFETQYRRLAFERWRAHTTERALCATSADKLVSGDLGDDKDDKFSLVTPHTFGRAQDAQRNAQAMLRKVRGCSVVRLALVRCIYRLMDGGGVRHVRCAPTRRPSPSDSRSPATVSKVLRMIGTLCCSA